MLPAIIMVLCVSFFPLVYAIRVSLFETNYLQMIRPNNFGHFKEILGRAEGWQYVFRSWYHVAGTVAVAVPFGFLLATLLNRNFRYKLMRTTFRSILILPYSISWLIAAFLWMWMLNPYYGVINYFLQTYFNFTMVDFAKSSTLAMPILIVTTSWRLYPLATLFILAGLQTIPFELIEATRIDGASGLQIFRYVTFPLIKNTVLVVMVLITLDTFNMVTLTLTLTGGGPGEATATLAFKAFQEGFHFWHVGYSTAIAVIIFIFNIVLSFGYTRVLRSERFY
jgi:ABC-type sugar transport system permease subunit